MKTTDELLYDMMLSIKKRKSIAPKSGDKKLLILSTPRSGSTLFCDVLNNTNKIGECREWFNMRYIAAYAKVSNTPKINFPDYLNFIYQKTIGNTGVFAVNMHIEQYVTMLNNKIDIKSLGFDSIVYLYRKDKISQAISLALAQVTDQWSSSTKAIQEIEGKINTKLITNALNQIIESEYIYSQNFKSITNMKYSYEDFSNLTDTNCFHNILNHLNINLPNFKPEVSTKKQRNNFSKEVSSEFFKYLTGDYKGDFNIDF